MSAIEISKNLIATTSVILSAWFGYSALEIWWGAVVYGCACLVLINFINAGLAGISWTIVVLGYLSYMGYAAAAYTWWGALVGVVLWMTLIQNNAVALFIVGCIYGGFLSIYSVVSVLSWRRFIPFQSLRDDALIAGISIICLSLLVLVNHIERKSPR